MAVLILIGKLKEKPTVIEELFDVEKNPCKPQYSLCHSLPLNLYACEFRDRSTENVEDPEEIEKMKENKEDKDLTEWVYSEVNISKLIETLQRQWSILNIQATMLREVANDMEQIYNEKNGPYIFKNQADILELGVRPKKYQSLLTRKRCESLENRMDHYIKRQRLTVEAGKDYAKTRQSK